MRAEDEGGQRYDQVQRPGRTYPFLGECVTLGSTNPGKCDLQAAKTTLWALEPPDRPGKAKIIGALKLIQTVWMWMNSTRKHS